MPAVIKDIPITVDIENGSFQNIDAIRLIIIIIRHVTTVCAICIGS
ncbi:hypothetical protein [Candidatus Liberibacter americanus]|nr:hypothetical protein [Candidatus Liberibacter americanus]